MQLHYSLIAAAAISAICPPSLTADTHTWQSNGAGTFYWDDTTQWNTGVEPDGAGEVAVFNGASSTQTISITNTVTVGRIDLYQNENRTITTGSGALLQFDGGDDGSGGRLAARVVFSSSRGNRSTSLAAAMELLSELKVEITGTTGQSLGLGTSIAGNGNKLTIGPCVAAVRMNPLSAATAVSELVVAASGHLMLGADNGASSHSGPLLVFQTDSRLTYYGSGSGHTTTINNDLRIDGQTLFGPPGDQRNTVVLNGLISGAGDLVFQLPNQARTMTFGGSQDNTWSGGLALRGTLNNAGGRNYGVLRASKTGALGTGHVTVKPDGKLQVSAADVMSDTADLYLETGTYVGGTLDGQTAYGVVTLDNTRAETFRHLYVNGVQLLSFRNTRTFTSTAELDAVLSGLGTNHINLGSGSSVTFTGDTRPPATLIQLR